MSIEVIHNEKNLLHQVATGDREAFRQLYGLYYKVVEGHMRIFGLPREAMDELKQDVFIKIWEKRGRLENVESFKNYVFIMSKNTVLNYFRSMKTLQKTTELSDTMESTGVGHAEDAYLYKQYYSIVVEGMEKLPTGKRKILKMSIEQGMTLDEIASELNISRAGVKKQLYAATAFVRQYLLEHAEMSLFLFVFLSLFEKM